MTVKSILAFVLRDADGIDCTANGFSAHRKHFTLIWAEEAGTVVNITKEQALAYCEQNKIPAYECGYLVVRTLFAAERASWHIVPMCIPDGKWKMFGGNWAYSSDSRFPVYHPQGFSTPIAIHDRVED